MNILRFCCIDTFFFILVVTSFHSLIKVFGSVNDRRDFVHKKNVTFNTKEEGSDWKKNEQQYLHELVYILDDDDDQYWVRDLTAPMHLGLINGPFVPHIKSREPCSFAKAPDGPQAYTLNILWFQKEGAQVPVSECGQSLTLTKNVSWGFLLNRTLPTQWAVQQIQQV